MFVWILGGIFVAALVALWFIPVRDEDLPQTPEEEEEEAKNWHGL